MLSFLRKLAEHGIPLGVAALLMAGSAVAGGAASGLITGADVKNSSLTGKDVKDRSLTPKDFSGSVKGPDGKEGPPGATGPPGPPGAVAAGTELVVKSTGSTTENPKELQVECPNGRVLSGGYVLYPPDAASQQVNLRAVRSYAISLNEWLVRAVDQTDSLKWELTVSLVCAT